MGTEAVRFLVVWNCGLGQLRLEVIDFLREENRVLREQLGGRRLRFTDDQRRFRKGCIILQKSDDTTVVEFRKIEILEKQ